MTRVLMTTCAFLLVAALPASAQSRAIAEVLERSAAGSFRNLTESAEKMPEAEYGFQATKETRTFAAFVGHTINSAYNNCSRAKGEANPNTANLEQETSKAALVAAARAVQAYCGAVYAAQNDQTLTEMVAAGQNQAPRVQLLTNIIAHNNNEYGQKVILMRLRGVVPPTTERAQAPRPGLND
ncbi:MAG: DinB family protein [Vicinamibacterales bacterium]|nr:DinB family protein [Vicinamibacterales bacterium]